MRPLLGVRRSQLAELCRQQGLQPVEDPTNASLAYLRNLLRHQLQASHRKLQGR